MTSEVGADSDLDVGVTMVRHLRVTDLASLSIGYSLVGADARTDPFGHSSRLELELELELELGMEVDQAATVAEVVVAIDPSNPRLPLTSSGALFFALIRLVHLLCQVPYPPRWSNLKSPGLTRVTSRD